MTVTDRTQHADPADAWPYDADPHHRWVVQHRLPVLPSWGTSWKYHVAVAVNPDSGVWPSLEPTEAEAAQLASYLRFWLAKMYRPSYVEQLAVRRPFDIDSGTVTLVFLKRLDGSWAYRRSTWSHGPWPFVNGPVRFETLVELLDKIEDLVPGPWQQWKADHPQDFPPGD